MRGYIRFVGGPWHNQHKVIARWPSSIYAYVAMEKVALVSQGSMTEPCEELIEYTLCSRATERGARYYEYIHLHNLEITCEDPNEYIYLNSKTEWSMWEYFIKRIDYVARKNGMKYMLKTIQEALWMLSNSKS